MTLKRIVPRASQPPSVTNPARPRRSSRRHAPSAIASAIATHAAASSIPIRTSSEALLASRRPGPAAAGRRRSAAAWLRRKRARDAARWATVAGERVARPLVGRGTAWAGGPVMRSTPLKTNVAFHGEPFVDPMYQGRAPPGRPTQRSATRGRRRRTPPAIAASRRRRVPTASAARQPVQGEQRRERDQRPRGSSPRRPGRTARARAAAGRGARRGRAAARAISAAHRGSARTSPSPSCRCAR